ncbi:hypothetical protein NXS19_008692 [Fusarium pseudograminearum]|uniref:Uncharacterized protein n=1 Tax=Fusarium pseudograminearum (strain CS3096) TaxID=1028729 RepID=K3VGN7_FUSPC|nr:hypothetical protein FPSE_06514 [Fusarium pseudograminearum CS3096]EKJ73249.1 hypothetical protein FPSE_06514 [Fusarium pseudograminearum CS3096]UZP40876.1 hypothetical protein NXS19_008692 [Fusarium pseudograminearum]
MGTDDVDAFRRLPGRPRCQIRVASASQSADRVISSVKPETLLILHRAQRASHFFVCSPYRATSASLLPTDDKVSRQPWRSCTSTVVIIESGRFFLSNNVVQVFPFEILGRAGKEILSSGLVEVDHGSVCRYSSRRRGGLVLPGDYFS